jgi:hypothetical protein
MTILRQNDLTSLEDDQEFQDKVLSIFHALHLTFEMTQCAKIMEISMAMV